MKSEMEVVMDRMRAEQADSSDKGYIRLQQQMIGKTQKIEELTREVEGLRDQLHRVKAERERLIQISNDLRADLNRSQRLANELMTKMTVTEPAQPHQSLENRQAIIQNIRGSNGTERGMFDVISSIEDLTPNKVRQVSQGQQRYEKANRSQLNSIAVMGSPENQTFRHSPEKDALQKYGQQMGNMAMEIQEWLTN